VAEGRSESLSNIWGTGELNGSQKGCGGKRKGKAAMDESRGRMTLSSWGLGQLGKRGLMMRRTSAHKAPGPRHDLFEREW